MLPHRRVVDRREREPTNRVPLGLILLEECEALPIELAASILGHETILPDPVLLPLAYLGVVGI